MPFDVNEVFRELTPPPGGPEKFRALLAARSGARRWLPVFALAAPAAAVAMFVLFAVVLPRAPAGGEVTISAALNPAVLRYQDPARVDDRSEAVSIPASVQSEMAVKRVTGTPDDVLFYWAASVARGDVDS